MSRTVVQLTPWQLVFLPNQLLLEEISNGKLEIRFTDGTKYSSGEPRTSTITLSCASGSSSTLTAGEEANHNYPFQLSSPAGCAVSSDSSDDSSFINEDSSDDSSFINENSKFPIYRILFAFLIGLIIGAAICGGAIYFYIYRFKCFSKEDEDKLLLGN